MQIKFYVSDEAHKKYMEMEKSEREKILQQLQQTFYKKIGVKK